MESTEEPLGSLIKWVEVNQYMGYDPYDYLSSPLFNAVKRRESLFYIQQIGKWLPIDMRRIIGIKRAIDPKGAALLVRSYVKLYNRTLDKAYLIKAEKLFENLLRMKDKNSCAWGFSFPWASRGFYLAAYEPNIVVTVFVGLAAMDLFEIDKKDIYLDVCRKIQRFLFTHLHEVYNDGENICLSYTKDSNYRIVDANMLAAEFVGRLGKIMGNKEQLDLTRKLLNYVDLQQQEDGYWLYGYAGNGRPINQLDYHQGFMIDSYLRLIRCGVASEDNLEKIDAAVNFYKNKLFTKEGVSCYRYPRKYPIDIHNQAQGIITFAGISEVNNKYLETARTISRWTIRNMQDKNGYFYFQKWPYFTNKIPYMRWSQAWMLMALACLEEASSPRRG